MNVFCEEFFCLSTHTPEAKMHVLRVNQTNIALNIASALISISGKTFERHAIKESCSYATTGFFVVETWT